MSISLCLFARTSNSTEVICFNRSLGAIFTLDGNTNERQKMILHALLEGNSIRSTERLTGVHRDTIQAARRFYKEQTVPTPIQLDSGIVYWAK
jgi:hypothetical protein